jgi:hypothetical protein
MEKIKRFAIGSAMACIGIGFILVGVFTFKW